MTDSALVPMRQAQAIEGRSEAGRVTGKLKAAIDAMIWEGKTRSEGAAAAGLKDSSLRSALRKPHVLQHYNAELAALRTSLRARNVHRLDRIADDSGNDMARVGAIKALENLADQSETASKAVPMMAGLQIVVIAPPPSPPKDAGEAITVVPSGA